MSVLTPPSRGGCPPIAARRGGGGTVRSTTFRTGIEIRPASWRQHHSRLLSTPFRRRGGPRSTDHRGVDARNRHQVLVAARVGIDGTPQRLVGRFLTDVAANLPIELRPGLQGRCEARSSYGCRRRNQHDFFLGRGIRFTARASLDRAASPPRQLTSRNVFRSVMLEAAFATRAWHRRQPGIVARSFSKAILTSTTPSDLPTCACR